MSILTGCFGLLLEISLSMSLVMALLLLCRPLLKKHYRAKWAYWAWLVVAARLLIPFNLPLPVTALTVPEPGVAVNLPVAFEGRPAAGAEGAADPGEPAPPNIAANPLPVTASVVMDGWTVVACLWLTGVVCALILTLTPYLRFRHQVRRWSTPVSHEAFDALCRQEGISGLTLWECGAVTVPMVSGFLRPVLLIPAGPLPSEVILRHEMVHHRRRDLWYKLLLLLAQCVHWFNPLVWLMGGAANRDLERACDEEVTAGRDGAYRQDYGRAILDAVADAQLHHAPLTSYFHGGKGAMLERLSSILNTQGKRRGAAALALLLVVAVLGGAFFAVGRPVAMEDDEFQITLPHGTTWEGPQQKPGLTAQFYQGGVQSGGLEQITGEIGDAERLLPPNDGYMSGFHPLHSSVVPIRDVILTRTGAAYEEIHYYVKVDEDLVCDLWFRLDLVSQREAATAADSFLQSLGAAHSKSPDGRYDLSYLLTGTGSRWLLRENGRITGAANTPGTVVWQTAQWSPDSKWATVWSGDGFAVLSPQFSNLNVTQLPWDVDAATPLEWGGDNRVGFSYVRKTDDGLESGTARYDPATGLVSQVEEDPDCVLVTFAPQDISPVSRPPWSMALPTDIEVRRDGMVTDATLLRAGDEVGSIQWTALTAEEMSGKVGLQKYRVQRSTPEDKGSMIFLFPVGSNGDAYRLTLSSHAFRQNLAQAMAEGFLVNGVPSFAWTFSDRAPTEAGNPVTLTFQALSPSPLAVTTLWSNDGGQTITYGNSFTLEAQWSDWTAVEPILESWGFTTVGYSLGPGQERTHHYDLEWLYGSLSPGQYRISTTYLVEDPAAPNGRYWENPVYGMFEIPETAP